MTAIYVYVRLSSGKHEWRKVVTATTLSFAMEIAAAMPDVIAVLEASFIPGGVIT